MAVKFEVVAASPRLARNAAQIILCKLCGAAASCTIEQCMSVAHYLLFNPKACNCYQSSLEEKCKNILWHFKILTDSLEPEDNIWLSHNDWLVNWISLARTADVWASPHSITMHDGFSCIFLLHIVYPRDKGHSSVLNLCFRKFCGYIWLTEPGKEKLAKQKGHEGTHTTNKYITTKGFPIRYFLRYTWPCVDPIPWAPAKRHASIYLERYACDTPVTNIMHISSKYLDVRIYDMPWNSSISPSMYILIYYRLFSP